MSRDSKDFFFKSMLISCVMGIMLCIFEPFQLYFTNVGEYWFDLYNLVPVCLGMFAVLWGVSTLFLGIFYLVNHKIGKMAYVIYAVAFVCTYIQGNYMAGNLPVLDGSSVDWQYFDYQRKYTILLWLTVILITAFLLLKKKIDFTMRVYHIIASIILGILTVTCLITGISNSGFADKGDLTVTSDKLFSYSKEGKNYVILLVDSVRGREMTQLLEEDETIRDSFRDFTYYDNTMVGYPLTFYSIYYLLSGDWYECDEMIDDYKENILLNAPLFEELEKRDYAMEMYTLELPFIDEDAVYRFDNLKRAQGKFTSYVKFAKLELRLVGLKYAPYDLKRRCLALPGEFDDLKMVEDIEGELYAVQDEYFISHLDDEVEYLSGNDFKLIHIDGAHPPFFHNKNWERLSEETDYEETVEFVTSVTIAYLNKLKEAGVYDNTAIIILSDHGINSEPLEGYYYNPYDRQDGILFIKGFNEQHDSMLRSNAPISHGDLQEAYFKLMDGNNGDDVFSVKEGEQRERRFLWHMNDNALRLEEYIQTGQAGDLSTLQPTGRIYEWPDGLISQ